MSDFIPLVAADSGEALLILLAVLVADFLLGIVPGLAKFVPVTGRIFTTVSAFFEARLNRPGRSSRDLVVRGILVMLILLALGILVGVALVVVIDHAPFGWVLGALVLLLCVGGRGAFLALRRGLRLVADEDIEAARALAGELAGRDASNLDRFGVGRAVIEHASVAYAQRVVTPVFWFALLGFPGLLLSRAISQLARTVVNRSHEGQAFGAAAVALDHALGLIPSYVAGYLLALASLVTPSAKMGRALHFMSLDAHRDDIVNDGRIKGAVAGALGLALGGPFGTRGGGGRRDSWIGNGRARVGQGDMRNTLYLVAVATLAHLALVALVVLVRL